MVRAFGLLFLFPSILSISVVKNLTWSGSFPAGFFVEIGVGNQNFTLIIDTGSSFTGIVSENCLSYEANCTVNEIGVCPQLGQPYQKEDSSASNITCTNPPGDCDPCLAENLCGIVLEYADGTCASGHVVRDSLWVGDLHSALYFVGLTAESGLTSGASDGILGLAYKSLSNDFPTVTDQLVASGDLNSNSFGLCLGPEPVMVFGDVAPEYSQGNFTYLDITDDSFYCVDLRDILFNGTSLETPLEGPCPTFIDSGTTLLILPLPQYESIVSTLLSLCPQLGNPEFLCGAKSILNGYIVPTQRPFLEPVMPQLPELEFVIRGVPAAFGVCDDVTFTLTAAQYIRTAPSQFGVSVEFGLAGSSDGLLILGDVFMKSFYIHFDKKTDQLAIAMANCGQPFLSSPSLSARITHSQSKSYACITTLDEILIAVGGVSLGLIVIISLASLVLFIRRRKRRVSKHEMYSLIKQEGDLEEVMSK